MPNPENSPWVLFTLTGELDMSRTPELDEMVASVLHHKPANAIVDLSGVTFLDSSAISWLLRFKDRADQVGRRLRSAFHRFSKRNSTDRSSEDRDG